MKKLTAGIFTVLLGVVAANSADAALTSKAYVTAELAKKQDTLTAGTGIKIDTATNTISTDGIATSDALATLEGKVTANTEAITKKADQTAMETALAGKQQKLNSTNFKKDGEGNVISGVTVDESGNVTFATSTVATTAGLEELTKTVEKNTADINTNTGAITTLNGADTVENSVAYKIKNALAGYTTTTDMNAKLDLKADKTTVAEDLAKKQNKLTAGTNIEIKEDGTINSTYDDSALDGRVTALEGTGVTKEKIDAIATNTTNIAKKQDTLTETQLSAVNSGITAAGVAQIETNKTAVAAVTNDLANNYTKTANLSDLAKATIPATCTDPNAANGCALILKNGVYSWEVVERVDGE